MIKLGVPSKGRLMQETFAWFSARGVHLSKSGLDRVPACWRDVTCLHDLDAVAARFRAQHGFRLRIATKYHRLVRQFMTAQGVADYQLVDSQGATEGAVKNVTAEAIAAITSTGATIKANHLQILEDGLVLKSQATLWHSKLAQGDCSTLIEKIGITP